MSPRSFCLSALLVLTACASGPRTSGFLTEEHYDLLQQVQVPSDHVLYRFVSPAFDPQAYQGVIVEKVVAFPKPEPTEQVPLETLVTLQTRLTELVESAFEQVLSLRKQPARGVLRVQMAITGVDVSTSGLEYYEVIPVALLAAGATTLAGARSQEVTLFLETRVTDSLSGEVLYLGVRELTGENLANVKERLEERQLNKGLSEAGGQMVEMVKAYFEK